MCHQVLNYTYEGGYTAMNKTDIIPSLSVVTMAAFDIPLNMPSSSHPQRLSLSVWNNYPLYP